MKKLLLLVFAAITFQSSMFAHNVDQTVQIIKEHREKKNQSSFRTLVSENQGMAAAVAAAAGALAGAALQKAGVGPFAKEQLEWTKDPKYKHVVEIADENDRQLAKQVCDQLYGCYYAEAGAEKKGLSLPDAEYEKRCPAAFKYFDKLGLDSPFDIIESQTAFNACPSKKRQAVIRYVLLMNQAIADAYGFEVKDIPASSCDSYEVVSNWDKAVTEKRESAKYNLAVEAEYQEIFGKSKSEVIEELGLSGDVLENECFNEPAQLYKCVVWMLTSNLYGLAGISLHKRENAIVAKIVEKKLMATELSTAIEKLAQVHGEVTEEIKNGCQPGEDLQTHFFQAVKGLYEIKGGKAALTYINSNNLTCSGDLFRKAYFQAMGLEV